MDKLKRVLNGNDDTSNEENRGIMGDVGVHFPTDTRYNQFQFNEIQFLNKYFVFQIDELTTLSWSTRIKGFCLCFGIGILFSLMGSLVLILHLGLGRFAVFYTLGNIISMAR